MAACQKIPGIPHLSETPNLRTDRERRKTMCIHNETTESQTTGQPQLVMRAAEKLTMLRKAVEETGCAGHDLQVFLVRILFCLFAQDTLIFPRDAFLTYLETSKEDGSDLALRLARLFEVLNMPTEERDGAALPAELLQFPYVDDHLFADQLPMAGFDASMRQQLIDACSFDWRHISPAVFGAAFQGVMDDKLRHSMGTHYTSEENIFKVINPLFMDNLRAEFDKAKTSATRLEVLHARIASLKFLDPACGCGSFLILAYRELRRLEYSILQAKRDSSALALDPALLLKVSVDQFSGIEIEEFPCQIARTGMWFIEHLMNMKLMDMEERFGRSYVKAPARKAAHIKQGNALTMDWNDVTPASELSYILGNPPFLGARVMDRQQKKELVALFPGERRAGNLDYVSGWYKKACSMMQTNKDIRTAFVSTNSISQGEQAALLWEPLFAEGIHINFAYRTIKWSNEARGKAKVYCVIIGFSFVTQKTSAIYDGDVKIPAANINGYLFDGPNIFVASRSKPLCDIPVMGIGNKPIDNGEYLFLEEEKEAFLQKEPKAEEYFYRWMGAEEFLNGKKRWCLYLGRCSHAKLRSMPECMKRVEAVRQYRLSSKSLHTQKLAGTPTKFHVENIPNTTYIVIPEVSSERRSYIPIGFLTPDILCSNLLRLIPGGTLYHFGVLTSAVHNAWMRAVAGRLEMRYRYSKDIVYNTFPWPEDVTTAQRRKTAKLAQGVLDARALYPGRTLADLYNPDSMPDELLSAHKVLDKAVLALYGFKKSTPGEPEIVADLFRHYAELVQHLCNELPG